MYNKYIGANYTPFPYASPIFQRKIRWIAAGVYL